MSKRVNISVDLGALQAAIGEWPGVGEVVTRLGKGQQHVHDMLDDGRLKGIRTRLGWISSIPRASSGLPVNRMGRGKGRSSSTPKRR